MKIILLTTVGTLMACAAAVNAQVIFSSGNYVTTNRDFVSPASTVNGTVNTRAFALATPSTGYSGPAFSAGYSLSANQTVTGLGYNRQRVDENAGSNFGGNDFINIQGVSTGAGNSIPANTNFSAAQVVFFAAASPFAVTSFEISALGTVRSGAVSQTGRYMVQTGGVYYLSFQTFTLTATATSFSYNFSGNLTWAAYDPTTAINFDQGAASFGALSLAAVQGAGIYAENDSFTTPNSIQTNYTISTLQVGRLEAIPEPSSLALLGVAVGAGWLIRRRRRG